MHPFLRTRVCRVVSVITAFTLSITTVLSTASVAFAAGAVSSSAPVAASTPSPATGPAPAMPAAPTAPAAPTTPTVVRELTERRSATATHYLLSDGSVRAEIQQSPVRFRDRAGAWRDLDADLVPADFVGSLKSASTPVVATFGARDAHSAPVGLAGDGYSVGIDYLDGVEGTRFAFANHVVYRNVASDTDLAYEVLSDGIKETVVLASASSPTRFRFALTLQGLQMRRDFSGTWGLFRPQAGRPTLDLAPLVVFDSSIDGAGDPAVCSEATMTVTPAGDVAYVTYEISPEWLADPARVFPVRVDPTLTLTSTGSYADTYLSSASPNTAFSTSSELKCGYYDSTTGYNRAYVRFDLSSVPDSAYVVDTTYKIHQYHQYCVSSATSTYLGVLEGSFGTTTTWNTQQSQVNQVGAECDYLTYDSVTGREANVEFSVDATVQRWLAGSLPNYGFLHYQREDGTQNTTHWRRFRSEDYSVAAERPTLYIQYSTPNSNNSQVDKGSYAPGEVVAATARFNSGWPADINAIKMSVRGSQGGSPVTRGSFMWSKTAPTTGTWEATACAGSAGGFVSYDQNAPGAGMLELLTGQCSATLDSPGNLVDANFVFRLSPVWGDVQDNDLIITGYMGAADGNDATSAYGSGERVNETNFDVTPIAPVVTGSDTSAAQAWFTETDPDGDGLSTDRNDTNASGRGAASLEWEEASGATAYRVYLFDGNTYRPVATTTASVWDSASDGLYPTDTQIAALSAGYAGNPFAPGTGLDLRDDPTPLYAKTAGTSVDGIPAYFFKVTSVNGAGETALSTQPTITVQLANRTKRGNEAVAHTSYDLGSVAGDGTVAELDSGVLTLSATDLSIESFGPFAGISRTYRSDVTSETLFARGWRFNFEQNIAVGPLGTRIYTDEGGERHLFTVAGDPEDYTWAAPHSMVATLTQASPGGTYALQFKGGEALAFDSAGRLTQETDRRQDSTTYVWTGTSGLAITAANDHVINATFSGGRITAATYATSSGTRHVEYPSRASVVRHPNVSESETVSYSYNASSTLSGVAVADFAPGGVEASWAVTYAGGKLARLHYPHPDTIVERDVEITYPSSSTATVSRPARVGLATTDSAVAQTYTWDPTGRQVCVTVPGESGEHVTDYAPSGVPRHSVTAEGVVSDSLSDSRGNELFSWDADGHTTANVYSADDDLVSTTDPRGAVTTYAYNAAGDELSEHRTLNATQSSETSRTYDDHGRMTSEGQLIDASGARVYTTFVYGDFFTEALATVKHDVALSSTSTVDLTSTQTLDDFGQVIESTDDAAVTVSETTYDLSGRVLTQTDAAGAATHYRYDLLGAEVETSRTAGTAWTDWTAKVVDPTGLTLTETAFVTSDGEVVPASVTSHLYDGSGIEISSTTSDVGSTKAAYDAKGDVTASWQPGVSTADTSTAQTSLTDADGREVQSQVTTATPAVTQYAPGTDEVESYDPSTEAETTYAYDEAGNQTAQTVPVSSGTATETTEYDLGGRAVRSVDAAKKVTICIYDLLGRLVSSELEGAGRATTTAYNTAGWVLSSADPDGRTQRSVYDRAGRVVDSVVSVEGETDSVTHHVFDTAGNETLTVNPDGTSIEMTYDAFARMVRRVESVGLVPVHDVRVHIDEMGRATETSDTISGIRTAMSYATSVAGTTVMTKTLADATMTVLATAAGIEGTRTFSVAGAPMGGKLTVTVKSRNLAQIPQMWKLSLPGVGLLYRTDVFDADGRMKFQMDQTAATYVYDEDTGLKTSEKVWGNSLLPSQDATYTYTDEGRLASAKTNGDVTGYLYDVAGQITEAGGVALTYSENKLATSTVGGVTTAYTFDARGRRTSQSSPSQSATYTWDPMTDRLTGYALDRAPLGSPDVVAAFTYDASGQRTGSVVTSGVVTTTSAYTYEGLQLTRLVSTTGGVSTTLTYLYDELGRPLAMMASSSDTSTVYPLSPQVNARGDVRGIVNMQDVPIASWAYDAYGNPTAVATGGTLYPALVPASMAARIAAVQPLRYAGYAYDEFSGLYYCSQRYYDPATMQFISADPAQADGEESAYQYCGGDPVGKTDPSGLRSDSFGGGGNRGFTDITKRFVDLLHANARFAMRIRCAFKDDWFDKRAWWTMMVYKGAPWDLKRNWPFGSTRARYKFRSLVATPEDLGNIHYGYVGRAMGFSRWELLRAGGVIHSVQGGTIGHVLRSMKSFSYKEFVQRVGHYEPADDKTMITYGMNLFAWRT